VYIPNDNSPAPKISIGLPVFNGEKTIGIAISSLLEQTYSNFELIISNNASTDTTAKICEYFLSIDQRIRYFEQVQNIGAVGNFNFVLQKAAATYFMWAASDDTWEPNWIELLLPESQKYKCLSTGKSQAINFDGSLAEHISSNYQLSFERKVHLNRRDYFITPSFLGKANSIYGIAPTQIFNEMVSNFNGRHGDMLFLYSLLSKYEIRLYEGTTRFVRLQPDFSLDHGNELRKFDFRYCVTYFPNMLRTVLKSVYFRDYWRISKKSERVMLLYLYPLAVVKAMNAIKKSRKESS
jgi:glycosyltransferase involved in cell wall biosynthesis